MLLESSLESSSVRKQVSDNQSHCGQSPANMDSNPVLIGDALLFRELDRPALVTGIDGDRCRQRLISLQHLKYQKLSDVSNVTTCIYMYVVNFSLVFV